MQVRKRALVALGAAVITVGAVLPAAFAAGGALRVDASGYQPAAWDPAIPEHLDVGPILGLRPAR